MRLDKFLSDSAGLTRSQAKKAIARGEVSLDGVLVRDAAARIDPASVVAWRGQPLSLPAPRYLMLHKPAGYVCSTVADGHPSVLDLLPGERREGLVIAGRLDHDTTGLVILTDDGQWAHRITRPGSRCGKRYRVQLAAPLPADAEARCAAGLMLQGEHRRTLPAELQRITPTEVRLTLHEGRYHQVKRMMAALGSRVTALHREQVGGIVLDDSLAPGQWRALADAEIASV